MSDKLDKIVEWLKSKNASLTAIGHDTDLLEGGYITSLSFVEFIMILEDLSNLEIDVDENILSKVKTLNEINKNFFCEVA